MLKIIRRSFANRASNNTYPCYVHRITRDCCTTDKLIIVDSLTLNPCPSHLLFSSPFRFHPSSNRIESLSSPSNSKFEAQFQFEARTHREIGGGPDKKVRRDEARGTDPLSVISSLSSCCVNL